MRDFMRPGRSVAVAENGMAATSHPVATLAAVDMLRSGGNAVDAALAAVAMHGVVDPHMTGIGGDCFALFAPAGKDPIALNGSGRAARTATLDWFLAQDFTAIPETSVHAVTVPGAVDAWCRLAEDYGRKGLEAALRPAIDAAEQGFLVTPRAALDWARYADRVARHEGGGVYLPGGNAPTAGDRLALPALAATLRRIGREGRAAFYEGAVADEIVTMLAGFGGFLQPSDLAENRADYVAPIAAPYRGHVLHECPPNGQGVAALLLARIVEGFRFDDPAMSEADRIHVLAEASKAAYRMRDLYVGDPDAAPCDVDRLLSDALVARLRSAIRIDRALPAASWDGPLHRDTVYVCVVDRDRNVVSLINSLFAAFGSGFYAPRAGVLLHNRGSGFRVQVGHPNAIGPGKRPMHTIIPALTSRNGRPEMAFGVMGGPYQAVGHAQILSNVLDRGDDPQAASDRPRSFAIDGELRLEPTIATEVAEDLARRGHRVLTADEPLGGCQAIRIDWQRGILLGGTDHRKDGIALGY